MQSPVVLFMFISFINLPAFPSNRLLLGKAGGTVNDINIKKNYGRLHFRELP